MNNYRILIADAVSADCDRILNDRGIETVRAVGLDPAALAEMLDDFDGIIVRSAVRLDGGLIGKMQRIRAIGRAGVGVDNIDVVAATERGIVVMNTPDGNTISACEHTVAMLLSLLRKIPAANQSLRTNQWDRKSFTGTELMGKRIGVLGLGRIGREVARRLQAFNTVVTGYDPMLTPEAVRDLGLEPVDLEEMIAGSDIITLHVPLTPETRGMIGADAIARMKPGACIINCARGGIVDEAALLAGLEAGSVAGAAMDVFESEPPTFPSPLIEHPRVVATPHIAASTVEAQERVAIDIAVQMADYFEGKGVRGVVNAIGLESSLGSEAQPLMEAAERLGAFLGQLVDNHDVGCQLTVYGTDATPIVRGLGAAFLAGMVGLGLDSTVNAINGEMLAERNRIVLKTEGSGQHARFTTMISAEVSNATERRTAAISVFGWNEPHLVMVDGIDLDIRPIGDMILFENLDRPGVLAGVSSVLASHGVNIAGVSLGRREGSGHALTVMSLDEEPSDTALEHLRTLKEIERIRTIHFS
jgi:D-3-phosphoglycerate dehydrogenase